MSRHWKVALAGLLMLGFVASGEAQAKSDPVGAAGRAGGFWGKVYQGAQYEVGVWRNAAAGTVKGLKNVRAPKPFRQWVKSEPKVKALYKAQKKAQNTLPDKLLAIGGTAGLVGLIGKDIASGDLSLPALRSGTAFVAGFGTFAGATVYGLKMQQARDDTIHEALLDPNIPDPPDDVKLPYLKDHPWVKDEVAMQPKLKKLEKAMGFSW